MAGDLAPQYKYLPGKLYIKKDANMMLENLHLLFLTGLCMFSKETNSKGLLERSIQIF